MRLFLLLPLLLCISVESLPITAHSATANMVAAINDMLLATQYHSNSSRRRLAILRDLRANGRLTKGKKHHHKGHKKTKQTRQ